MNNTLSKDQSGLAFCRHYTVVRRPSGSLETDVSRKAILLSFSVSMVKQASDC